MMTTERSLIPDVLLDTTWHIQHIPDHANQNKEFGILLRALADSATGHGRDNLAQAQLDSLSQECTDYILARGRAEPFDELNDKSEKTGSLRECTISALQAAKAGGSKYLLGLLIEARFQKTVDQLILLTSARSDGQAFVPVLLLKGGQGQIKKLKDWLDFRFDLSPATSTSLPSDLLCSICSQYLEALNVIVSAADVTFQQSLLKQVIGTLKISIAFTSTGEHNISPDLKTLDLDIPSETIEALLKGVAQRSSSDGSFQNSILLRLGEAIREKTGLILPFAVQASTEVTDQEQHAEPSLKVSRLSCAAFAVSAEGRLKLARKPIEHAGVTGYDAQVVSTAYLELLELLVASLERTEAGD